MYHPIQFDLRKDIDSLDEWLWCNCACGVHLCDHSSRSRMPLKHVAMHMHGLIKYIYCRNIDKIIFTWVLTTFCSNFANCILSPVQDTKIKEYKAWKVSFCTSCAMNIKITHIMAWIINWNAWGAKPPKILSFRGMGFYRKLSTPEAQFIFCWLSLLFTTLKSYMNIAWSRWTLYMCLISFKIKAQSWGFY